MERTNYHVTRIAGRLMDGLESGYVIEFDSVEYQKVQEQESITFLIKMRKTTI